MTVKEGDRSDKAYWEERTKSHRDDLRTALFADARYEQNDEMTRRVLEPFKDCTVVDVCCGYGRFAPCFHPDNYFGFDFCEEMIRLAHEKFEEYHFELQDARTFDIPKADIVFSAISLRVLNMSAKEFYEKYKNKANVAVICTSADDITIFPIYQ